MTPEPNNFPHGPLRVHLLGTVDYDEAARLQRGLVYRLTGGEDAASLILCEHPPLITVGRHGGAPLQLIRDELTPRGWHVRWVARGGGTFLHLPGQLAVYPVLPLKPLGLDPTSYIARLQCVLLDVLDDFGIHGETKSDEAGVWAGGRLVAAVGVALRHEVSTFGAILNVDPDLTLFRHVRSGANEVGYTSIARERRGPLRPQLVRQRLVEHFAARFGFERVDLIFPTADQAGHERLTVRR